MSVAKCLKQYHLLQQHRVNAHDLLNQSLAHRFRILEQYAGYRDRPYHPLAKLKEGLSQQEYMQYCPNSLKNYLFIGWLYIKIK